MSEFKLSILGSGSAMGGINAFHTSQVLSLRNKQFMIDCGEGAQIKLREYGVSVGRMNHIFISHLHGDHCFGLLGLISTLGMTGRKADFTIHAHPDLEKLFAPMFDYFCQDFPFSVHFESFSPYKSEIIYDDKSVVITTLPLKHRVPSSGFLFEEKATERHLNRAMADAYNIPVCKFKNIKAGEDFVTNPPTAYQSDFTYPGYPYDKNYISNDLHMLASSREGAIDPRLDESMRLDRGIPGLMDGGNHAAQEIGTGETLTITHIVAPTTTDAAQEMMIRLPETALESAKVKFDGGEAVSIVVNADITCGAGKFKVTYADMHKGLFALKHTAGTGDGQSHAVNVSYKKKGLIAGMPTMLDWDGCVGIAQILLQK